MKVQKKPDKVCQLIVGSSNRKAEGLPVCREARPADTCTVLYIVTVRVFLLQCPKCTIFKKNVHGGRRVGWRGVDPVLLCALEGDEGGSGKYVINVRLQLLVFVCHYKKYYYTSG